MFTFFLYFALIVDALNSANTPWRYIHHASLRRNRPDDAGGHGPDHVRFRVRPNTHTATSMSSYGTAFIVLGRYALHDLHVALSRLARTRKCGYRYVGDPPWPASRKDYVCVRWYADPECTTFLTDRPYPHVGEISTLARLLHCPSLGGRPHAAQCPARRERLNADVRLAFDRAVRGVMGNLSSGSARPARHHH